MTDKLETAVRNGRHAAMIIDDPVLKEALDKLEQLEIEALLLCPTEELIERRANVNAIGRLRHTLRAYVDNGKIAERSLKTN